MTDVLDLIVSALSAGAVSASKETASALIKDSYQGVKSLITQKFGQKVSVENLERNPNSEAKRTSLKEDLSDNEADKDEELLYAVKLLLEHLKADSGEEIVAGVNISEVEAQFIKIDTVKVKSNSAVKVNKVKLSGGIEVKNIESGDFGNP